MAVRSNWASRSSASARGILVVLLLSLHTGIAARPHVTLATEPSDQGFGNDGISLFASREQRQEAISALPLNRLTPEARQRIQDIVQSPTIYRRLPTQAIDCDRDMFLFLTRNPEVLVGMWDLMDVTHVATRRTGPFQLEAEDGSGTTCKVDLVYGDSTTHIFVADGSYDGRMVAKPIQGKGVFLLRSSYAQSSSGGTTVAGTNGLRRRRRFGPCFRTDATRLRPRFEMRAPCTDTVRSSWSTPCRVRGSKVRG